MDRSYKVFEFQGTKGYLEAENHLKVQATFADLDAETLAHGEIGVQHTNLQFSVHGLRHRLELEYLERIAIAGVL